MQSFRCRPRCSGDDAVGLLYAVGGLTKAGDSLSTVEVMDPVTGEPLFVGFLVGVFRLPL